MGDITPPKTDPAESGLSSHGRKSCLRVSRRDANQLCVHKLRTENSVSLAIGSNSSDQNPLITERSKSVQNSSARAASHQRPEVKKRINQKEINKLPGVKLETIDERFGPWALA